MAVIIDISNEDILRAVRVGGDCVSCKVLIAIVLVPYDFIGIKSIAREQIHVPIFI